MKRHDLIELLASETDSAPAVAADCLDRVVSDILKRLRSGAPVELPGIGVLQTGMSGIQFRSQASRPRRKKEAR